MDSKAATKKSKHNEQIIKKFESDYEKIFGETVGTEIVKAEGAQSSGCKRRQSDGKAVNNNGDPIEDRVPKRDWKGNEVKETEETDAKKRMVEERSEEVKKSMGDWDELAKNIKETAKKRKEGDAPGDSPDMEVKRFWSCTITTGDYSSLEL